MYDNCGCGTVASSLALSNMKLLSPTAKCSRSDGMISKVAVDSTSCNCRDCGAPALAVGGALVVESEKFIAEEKFPAFWV
jgi:hypothetical protein